MHATPATCQSSAGDAARILLAVLAVLLRALLGGLAGAAARRDHRSLEGSMNAGAAALEDIDLDPYDDVEWIAVPVPWRNGFWWVKPRMRWQCAAAPSRRAPYSVPVRAPPCPGSVRLSPQLPHRRARSAGAFARPMLFQW